MRSTAAVLNSEALGGVPGWLVHTSVGETDRSVPTGTLASNVVSKSTQLSSPGSSWVQVAVRVVPPTTRLSGAVPELCTTLARSDRPLGRVRSSTTSCAAGPSSWVAHTWNETTSPASPPVVLGVICTESACSSMSRPTRCSAISVPP